MIEQLDLFYATAMQEEKPTEKELQEKLEQYEYTHAYGGKYSPNQKY